MLYQTALSDMVALQYDTALNHCFNCKILRNSDMTKGEQIRQEIERRGGIEPVHGTDCYLFKDQLARD